MNTNIKQGSNVSVKGFKGIAFTYRGPEIEKFCDEDEGIHWSEPEERETGRVIVVMVGDDHEYKVDPEDMTEIDEEDFCGGCGQIGCGWH